MRHDNGIMGEKVFLILNWFCKLNKILKTENHHVLKTNYQDRLKYPGKFNDI